MSKDSPIYNVIIGSKGATLRKIKPGKRGYAGASKKAILRQRDAIELFQRLKTSKGGLDGVFSFRLLDTAKAFAMLYLEAAERQVQDNLDRVQAYDGKAESSDG